MNLGMAVWVAQSHRIPFFEAFRKQIFGYEIVRREVLDQLLGGQYDAGVATAG
ncbi:hypothetical protein X737_38195 [Mesorhizobium sp. L48C026A00]|nr:hypothetical protein X737_38195 [Mesorhizobium sp. L48C026A00]